MKYWEDTTSTGVVRCSRDHADILSTALPFITKLDEQPCYLHVLHVAGTIRSCQEHLLQHHLQTINVLAASGGASATDIGRLTSLNPIIPARFG